MTFPTLSYTIWFSQRVGSTWLCDMLARLGNAGRPGEHLSFPDTAAVFEHYGTTEPAEVLARIHALGSTDNGVFGIKQGFSQPRFDRVLAAIDADAARGLEQPPIAVWEAVFPCHHHVFLTRRNKLRLAVSWWKAIKSDEWHRRHNEHPADADLADAYDANALRQLLAEAVMREAGIGEILNEAGVAPLTIFYEDMVLDPQRELSRILALLELPQVAVPHSDLEVLADDLSEAWVQRFRRELQQGWTNTGW